MFNILPRYLLNIMSGKPIWILDASINVKEYMSNLFVRILSHAKGQKSMQILRIRHLLNHL